MRWSRRCGYERSGVRAPSDAGTSRDVGIRRFPPERQAGDGGSSDLRILFVQTQIENAGAQEIARLVGDGLAARGHVVRHLFFYNRTGGADLRPDFEACAEARPGDPLAFLRFVLEARRRVARFAPDVVLTFQHWGNALGAPIVRSVTRAPIVANQVSAPELIGFVPRELDRLWGKIGVYGAVTTNSEATRAQYARHGGAYRERLVSVPYGCAIKTSAFDRDGARRALGLPLDAVVLGTAARFHPTKRLDRAIAVLAELPGRHLALAGQGQENERLRAFAAERGVADRVHFLGEMAPTAIGDLLAAIDVFVFPSALESFGLAPLEAAVAGVPVVAADLPVLREVLNVGGREGALFVDVEDAAAFAATVRRVEPGAAERADLVEAGRALAGRHSLDRMVEAYAALAEDLVAGRSDP